MSHAIGDGTTYFQLVSQISAYMNGNEPEPIEWNNPLKSIHEIYPDNFTERDYHRSYGLPFGWGLAKNLRALPQRHCKYLLLSKDKILKVKNEMRKSKDASIINDDKTAQGRISTNDIVMSAICQLNGSSDVFAFDRSVRGIKEGINVYDAGNLFWEIPFDKEAGSDPVEIRKILLKDSSSFYDSDGVPLMPFLNGRVGRITSLATVTHQTTFPGSELLCQFPSASFINELPLDVAVIFKFNSDYWVSASISLLNAIKVDWYLHELLCYRASCTTSGRQKSLHCSKKLWLSSPMLHRVMLDNVRINATVSAISCIE